MINFIPQPPAEARSWLRTNPDRSAFATNRFGETKNAIAFVEALYARGATEVLVHNPGLDSDGDPYADTLVVVCGDPHRRHDMLQFCEEEGPGDEPPGDSTIDATNGGFRLWWD